MRRAEQPPGLWWYLTDASTVVCCLDASPWSDGELEREYEEQARLLKELDGGRVVFGEDDDWGVDLPPYHQRPDWAPSWVPTWAVTLHPLAQGAVTLVLYFLHMLVLSKVGREGGRQMRRRSGGTYLPI